MNLSLLSGRNCTEKVSATRFRVHDMDRSINFYNSFLGMNIVERETSPRGSQLVFLRFFETNCDLELCSFLGSGNIDIPEDLVHLAFQVEDLGWCMTKLEGEGVPITGGPIEAENGTRFIFTEDLEKYEIELMQYSKK